jgi:hypothetical protein
MLASKSVASSVRMDDPFGGWYGPTQGQIMSQMLEAALILLSVVCFFVLDRYIAGCERV